MKKTACILLYCLFALTAAAQNKTISEKNAGQREAAAAHKVLIIPFEPRLYFGEIDYSINAETRLTAKEIKHKFRDGIDEKLYKAFKGAGYNVLDLMEDTAKYKKDLAGIYQYLGYEYQKVPNQDNYQPPKKEATQKTVEKGQLAVETNSDARFMNARLNNLKILTQLNSKYKTDVFVFINQLDLKASGSRDPSQVNTNEKRRITVHYTVFTLNGKEINSGVAEQDFEPTLNNPKKIIDTYFSTIAAAIVLRVNKGLGFAPASAQRK